jgi:hypothetical protein
MIKKACAVVIIGSAVFTWASNTSVTEIDAVSTATVHNNIKFVVPLKVESDSAIIKWTDARSRSKSGTVALTYGTNDATMKTRSVTTAEATALSFNLTGLTPITTYKIRLQVTQPGGAHGPCADTATITTAAATSSASHFLTKKDVPLELLDHSIRIGSMARHGDQLSIVDTKGQTLLSHIVSGNETAVVIPSSVKGVVFLTCRRNENIISGKKVTIIH